MTIDEQFMSRCIQLAKLGKGNVAPNPMVGAVIVHEGKIIGEGYHQKYAEAHAEVNAVNSVEDKSLLPFSTIYVSLEPCSHHGKTPPCADLLVAKQFKRVVIGTLDANSQVDGKGIKRLKEAGIAVSIGILEAECQDLNKHFFTAHRKKRPYVLLKWAQSPNGYIDAGGNKSSNDSRKITWISTPEFQSLSHQWRNEYQSILIGRKTVESDNPSLTVRAVEGTNPIRIVLDSHLKIQGSYHIFNDEAKTYLFNLKQETNKKGISATRS